VDAGLVIVDKAAGLTSHDVVARLRRILGTRKIEESAGTMAQGAPVLRLRLDTVVGTVKVYRR